MKLLQGIQRQYAIVGIHPSNQSSQKYLINARISFGFLSFGFNIVSQFVYILRTAEGFMEYVECVCATSGSIIMFVCFAGIVFRETKLFENIDNFEKLIDSRCKCPKSKRLFLKSNQQVERLCGTVLMVIEKILLQSVMLPKCIGSFIVYFFTNSGNDSFQLPVPMWFPFNSNNPIGYLIAVILEYIMYCYEYFIVACTLGLAIGAYLITISVTKDIQRILHSINGKAQTNKDHSKELKILISEYIPTHVAMKQVEHVSSDIFQPMIMSLFTWSLLAISGVMLMIQMEILHHGNVMPLLLTIINGIIGLTLVFITCEIGQRMADAFDKINFTIDKFKWYLFPIEIKRMLPIIIANAQQPVSLECFGNITCTREVFKKIIHSALSYFMILRQLDD